MAISLFFWGGYLRDMKIKNTSTFLLPFALYEQRS
jgi:hypothetical protein